LLGIALLAGGCATTAPRAALPEVQAQLAARTEAPAPGWPLTPEEQSASAAQVRALLAKELTVDSAVQIALLNNRSLRATFEELGLSQAGLAAAARLPNPALSASVRWPHDTPHGPNAEFGLSLPLLDALLLPARKHLARDELLQTQYHVSHAILELTAKVRRAAYAVLAEQTMRDRLQQIAGASDAAAGFAQKQFDAGNIPRLDLVRLQAAAQESRLDLVRHTGELQLARESLNRLLGLASNQTDWRMGGALPALPTADDLPDDLEKLAQSNRLDLAARRAQAALAETRLDLKRKTRWLPGGLNLGADTERESGGGRLTGPNLSVELPLFDQGQPEIARLAALARQTRDQAEAMAAEVASETRAAQERLATARQADRLFQDQLLPSLRAAFQQTLLHYNAMELSVYELLAARREDLRAELESISARRDYWQARVELERAVGRRLPLTTAPSPAPDATPAQPTAQPSHSHHH
jgi:cobalt-zinc-cadmium efflux system outer membrane protein